MSDSLTRRLGADVVKAPIVVVVVNRRDPVELCRELRGSVVLEMGDDARIRAAEVLLVPVINAGDDEPVIGDQNAALVINVIPRTTLEQLFCDRRRERPRLQVRTAERGAVERVMHARIAPDRPQDSILYVVERNRLTFNSQTLVA